MSALSVEFEDLFLGQPDQLESRADALVAAAEAIARATESLRAIVDGQTSQSTDTIAETAADVARSLNRARLRYLNTGTALQTYAVELRPIQRDARSALSSAEYYEQRTYSLPGDISEREGDLVRAQASDASVAAIDRIEDDLWRLRQSQSSAHGHLQDARSELQSARDRIRTIADTAIAQIETAIEGDHDSAADNWNQFWEGAAAFIGEWAAGVLKGILEFLGELLAVLVAIVVIVLVIIVVAIVISAIIAAGPIAMILAATILATMIAAFLIRDGLGSPKGPATPKDFPATKRPRDADSADSAEDFTAEDYGDLFEEVGRQDTRGGSEATLIRVVAITDADGNVIGYRVQLPSTQNWSPGNTDGALNDLSADAMLALFPELETQYEKAVWDALERSGALDSDAPIMLTGWSLGGMMAGDLATDPRISDRVQAVVTAGSAIDKHAGEIDPSVRVTQVNNRWDPVHTLELVGYTSSDVPGDNWQTYRPTDIRIHNADMYGELADDAIPEVRQGDDIFFADDVDGTYEQVYDMMYTRG